MTHALKIVYIVLSKLAWLFPHCIYTLNSNITQIIHIFINICHLYAVAREGRAPFKEILRGFTETFVLPVEHGL
jgi:hypothetical protein